MSPKYTDSDNALISSKSTEVEPQEKPEPSLPQISMCLRPWSYPKVGLYCVGKIKEAEERRLLYRLTLYISWKSSHIYIDMHTHTQK